MNLEDNFKENINKWSKHCKSVSYSSNPREYIDCNPYRNLVSMGKDILPLIRDLYNGEKVPEFGFLGLPYLVSEIVREEFKIPKEIYWKVEKIEKFTKNWLDENAT